jgi:hypothetical protein
VVEQRTVVHGGQVAGIDKIVGLLRKDIEPRLAGIERDLDPAGGMTLVELQPGRVHAPVPHGLMDAPAQRVVANARNEQRGHSEGLQVPGDVERRAAGNHAAVGKTVVEHLTEDHDARIRSRRHGALPVESYPIHSRVQGR